MKFTVVAHTSTDAYGWKILVEIGRDTFGKLKSEYGPSLPSVGSVVDFSQTFDRLQGLESRERKVKEFKKLLNEITETEGVKE